MRPVCASCGTRAEQVAREPRFYHNACRSWFTKSFYNSHRFETFVRKDQPWSRDCFAPEEIAAGSFSEWWEVARLINGDLGLWKPQDWILTSHGHSPRGPLPRALAFLWLQCSSFLFPWIILESCIDDPRKMVQILRIGSLFSEMPHFRLFSIVVYNIE